MFAHDITGHVIIHDVTAKAGKLALVPETKPLSQNLLSLKTQEYCLDIVETEVEVW